MSDNQTDRVNRLRVLEEDVTRLPENTPDLDTIKDLIGMFKVLVEKGSNLNEPEIDRWIEKISKRVSGALEKVEKP